MCRFLAYGGPPILMEELITAPAHSLVHQSLHACEGKTETNGDGFGLGWYGERDVPGLYRDVRPAWSDENLLSIAAQVRSCMFLAHVRAATGTATTRANCHPFSHGRWLFMHNGQVGGWCRVRRRVEAMISDTLYLHRAGTTDSEAIFLAAISRGLEHDPVGVMRSVFDDVAAEMYAAGIAEPLRFTATLGCGETLFAFRWSTDAKPPSLYYKQIEDALLIVSEPTDGAHGCWTALSPGSALIAPLGGEVSIRSALTAEAA